MENNNIEDKLDDSILKLEYDNDDSYLFDPNITGDYLEKVIDLRLSSNVKFSKYVYDYYLISQEYLHYTWYIPQNKILKYVPTSAFYFRFYEIYYKFLKNINYNNVIQITSIPILNELKFLINKINNLLLISNNKSYFKTKKKIIKKLKSMSKYDEIFNNNIIDINLNNKSDFIFYSNLNKTHKYNINILKFTKLNNINFYNGMIFILKNLAINGSVVINVRNLFYKFNVDIYLILKKYFKESYIYIPEIYNLFNSGGVNIILKYFTGISDNDFNKLYKIYEIIKNIYPNGVEDINIYNKELRKKYNIRKKINPKTKNIYSLLNIKTSDPIYDEIRHFNIKLCFDKINLLNKLNQLSKLKEEELPKLPTQYQIDSAIIYLKKWNIPHYNFYTDKYFKDNILNKFYNVLNNYLFEVNTPYKSIFLRKYNNKSISNILDNNNYKSKKLKQSLKDKKTKKLKKSAINIKTKKKNIDIDNKLYNFYTQDEVYLSINEELEDLLNRLNNIILYVESRRNYDITDKDKQLAKYYNIINKFKFFNSKIKKYNLLYLFNKSKKTNYNLDNLILMEVLNNLNNNANIFNNIKLNTSDLRDCLILNSNNKIKKTLNIFLNSLNIDKINITEINIENKIIKGKSKYNKNNKKYDFIINLSELTELEIKNKLSFIEKDKDINKLLYFNLLSILQLLQNDGSFISRLIIPGNYLIWTLLFMCYKYFKYVYLYKDNISYDNREYILICIGYLGIPEDLINILNKSYKLYGVNFELFEDIYPEPFVLQIRDVYKSLIENYIKTVENKIFMYDNIDLIKDLRIEKLIYDGIMNKNKLWLKYFKF